MPTLLRVRRTYRVDDLEEGIVLVVSPAALDEFARFVADFHEPHGSRLAGELGPGYEAVRNHEMVGDRFGAGGPNLGVLSRTSARGGLRLGAHVRAGLDDDELLSGERPGIGQYDAGGGHRRCCIEPARQ